MSKPRLLDSGCCAGGAGRGSVLAGFEVTGIDLESQPRYPSRFIQADMFAFPLDDFDAYHASPHCQRYSSVSLFYPGTREKYPDQIDALRERLQATGRLYVIENVAGSPVRKDVMLCGAMFGLRTYRHRYFESNVLLFQPDHPWHRTRAADAARIPQGDEYWSICGHFGHKQEAQAAMGIDWMETPYEIAQALPPAYTAWVGQQLMEVLVCHE